MENQQNQLEESVTRMNEKIESLENDLKNSRHNEEQLKQDAETTSVEILELKESLMSENRVSWLHVV